MLSTFFVIAGFAYSLGKMESATMLLLLGIGFSIYVLVLATLVVRFFVPIKVMMSDDGVVLHYSGRRIRNIAWSEIRTLRYEAPIKSVFGKKKGDVIRFELDGRKTLVSFDSRISDELKRSYRDWCARTKQPENITTGRKIPVHQIIRGEVHRRRGVATIAFGVILGIFFITFAHITVGLSYLPFTILFLIIVISGSGFFVLFGIADMLGDSRYLKYAILSILGGLIPVTAFLAVVTLYPLLLLGLALAIIMILWAYVFVWRKIPKKGMTKRSGDG